ncbi:MAG TPA: potassium channel family protein, partial [Methanomicrobiales archaeon]|nr:potassium channel family protein [Methanomicrobiales archaeon]
MGSVSPIRIYATVLALACIVGFLGSMALEGLTPLDAAYYVVSTIATVGYGDIAPKTSAGRVLA